MKSKNLNSVLTLPVGQMRANCYLIVENKSKKCLIIDPGDDPEYIESIIKGKELTPQAILTTHGHFDHIMGATHLRLNLNIPFIIHRKDAFLVKDMAASAKYFLSIDTGPPPLIDGYIEVLEGVEFGEDKIQVIETSGHTPGSVCLYSKKNDFLICGDLIFSGGGVGRSDFSYSNKQKLLKSIAKILHLPETTTIYPGHGPATTVKEELLHHNL